MTELETKFNEAFAKPELTADYLRELLEYDKDTGVFVWGQRKFRTQSGSVAGCLDPAGYRVIKIDERLYKAHRLAWLYVYGEMPKGHIDHINHNHDDNRIKNLRCVDDKENAKNRPLYKNNVSGIPGVAWKKREKKWTAYIKVDGKHLHLGTFDEKQDAIRAREDAKIKHGFHKNHA